jgi:capsular exopolysaccharide synthesis family protein
MMSQTVERPDLELMMRGRPMELPSVRVQIIPPPPSGDPRKTRSLVGVFQRHRVAIGAFLAAGILAGLMAALLQQPWYEARAAIEPPPSENAEVEAKQMTDPVLVRAALANAQLANLSEYSRLKSAGALLRDVLGNLRVTASPQGRVVDIAFRATDEQRAISFLGFLVNGFLEQEVKLRNSAAISPTDPLAKQIAQAKATMQRAEDDLIAYAYTARMALDPQSGSLIENRFAQVKENIAGLESKYPSGSPQAAEARKLADALRRAQAEYSADRTAKTIRYQSKKQDLETKRGIYDGLVKKHQAILAEVNAEKNSRILAAGHVPGGPIRPNPLSYMMFGLLGGILAAASFCAVRETRNTKLMAPGEIATYVNVPDLGTIPHMNLDVEPSAALHGGQVIDLSPAAVMMRRLGAPEEFIPVNHLAGIRYPGDPGESFRSVLASIWIAGQNNKRPRVLLFASPGSGEGKTSIVTNLGIALANTNRRVLILEADLRHPQLHTVFGESKKNWGLANILEETEPVEDYRFEDLTLQTSVPGLYVLPAGTGETNIASMQYVDRLSELLTRFRLEFHAVLIDTPGALGYPDARVIGRMSDGAVLVFRSGVTDREKAAALHRRFQDDGINVLGGVLNDYQGN